MQQNKADICIVHEKLQKMPVIDSNCRRLTLRRNLIKEISLPQSQTLRYLDLYDNQISQITCLENTPNLEFLDLSFNLISRNNVPRLEFLTEFYLIGNDIEIIEKMDFPNLCKLDMAENEIKKIENLENLEKLEELYLANNRIGKIENVKNLNLRILDLQYNKIDVVDCNDLPENLETLMLTGNINLKEILNLDRLKKLSFLVIVDTQLDPEKLKTVYNGEIWDGSNTAN